MKIVERRFELDRNPNTPWLDAVQQAVEATLEDDEVALRAVITKSSSKRIVGECLVTQAAARTMPTTGIHWSQDRPDIFYLDKRHYEDTRTFNSVVMIPTGIGAAIGGHAGDAGPVVKLFGALSDTVITHPNVVGASDFNEMPANTLYVEGSVLTRLMMGQIGLQPVRNNNVLVVIDDDNPIFTDAAINAVNAARASYGFRCLKVVKLKPSYQMVAEFSKTGRATGELHDIDRLIEILQLYEGQYDAVALSSPITIPDGYRDEYFKSPNNVVNPWGGAEAMLTHAVSHFFNVPSAHSPMAKRIDDILWNGICDPRLAAETISLTFLQCILKGLQRSPRIIEEPAAFPGVATGHFFSVHNVSVLVQPDGVIGLPTLAALEQGIPVIAVVDNKNLMANDLSILPWAPGQFHKAQSYLNAAGIALALKAGIDPNSVRRPLRSVEVKSLPNG